MGTKYTLEFSQNAVGLLNKLKRDNILEIDDKIIDNVRKLCIHLGISSYTLYEWNKKFDGKIIDYEKDSLEDVEERPLKHKRSNHDIIVAKPLVIKSEIRFWGLLASALGIPNYSSMTPSDLQLKIGIALIKRSGLVQTNVDKILNGKEAE